MHYDVDFLNGLKFHGGERFLCVPKPIVDAITALCYTQQYTRQDDADQRSVLYGSASLVCGEL